MLTNGMPHRSIRFVLFRTIDEIGPWDRLALGVRCTHRLQRTLGRQRLRDQAVLLPHKGGAEPCDRPHASLAIDCLACFQPPTSACCSQVLNRLPSKFVAFWKRRTGGSMLLTSSIPASHPSSPPRPNPPQSNSRSSAPTQYTLCPSASSPL